MALSETKLNGRVCAVISAAGLSSRMGGFKPLLPFGGGTVAERCVDNLRSAGADDVVIVTGYRGTELRAALADSGVRFAENPDYRTTQMFDSLRIGLAALPEDCSRVLIQPVDMPAILPATITALLNTEGAAVRPVCGGKPGHPLLLDAALIPRVLTYHGADGLRGALSALDVAVKEVPTEDTGTLLDADTKEDYDSLLKLYESRCERTVYLFRHGLPEFPGGVRCCLGQTPDLPLSAAGYAAVSAWTAFLKAKGITGIYTSPALRCRETAAALSGGLFPVTVVDEFHELNYGEWEGLPFDEIKTRYADLYAQRGNDMSLMPPGGETVREAGERGLTALCELLDRTRGEIAVVAHAGLNRALLRQISGAPLREIGRFRQDYAHVNTIVCRSGALQIRAVNQSADELT